MSDKVKNFSQFPNIRIPKFLDAPAWLDESYSNDVTAHMRMDLPTECGYELWVWVHPSDPAKRESADHPRYAVVVYEKATGDPLDGTDCNTEKQCIRAIEHWKGCIELLETNRKNAEAAEAEEG